MNQDNLQDFLSQCKIEFRTKGQHHHTTDGWVQVDCPYCSSDDPNTFRLGLSDISANCWRCGKKGLVHALITLTKKPASECRKYLHPRHRVKVSEVNTSGILHAPEGVGKLEVSHRRYIRSIGLRPKEIESLWGVQGIALASRLSWRLFIPIRLDNRTVSWTTRSISPNSPVRYISAKPEQEIIQHKNILYGEDLASHSIIIVEGPKDAWAIGPGAVATFGTNYTPAQVSRMANFPIRYVCFDAESIAQKQANRLCEELSLFEGETHNIELKSKDPGSATRKELKRLRNLLK